MLNKKIILGSVLAASCAMACLAIVATAQYNSYDSDSDSGSDSDGGLVLSNAELSKLVRNSARAGAARGSNLRNDNQQHLAATRNLYNKQQPLQYAPTQNTRRQYGMSDLSGYGPLGAAASGGQANNDDDDENQGGFGRPGYGADSDDNDGESGSQADGQPMNLNQAASGYPGQGDYNEGFNFGGSSGYGPAQGEAGADFGMGDSFNGDGRRAKSASSLMGSRDVGDEDAGAPQFGPNSAVNSGDNDEEGRAGYAPEGGDNDNDDE